MICPATNSRAKRTTRARIPSPRVTKRGRRRSSAPTCSLLELCRDRNTTALEIWRTSRRRPGWHASQRQSRGVGSGSVRRHRPGQLASTRPRQFVCSHPDRMPATSSLTRLVSREHGDEAADAETQAGKCKAELQSLFRTSTVRRI